jgi:hypothetical protein
MDGENTLYQKMSKGEFMSNPSTPTPAAPAAPTAAPEAALDTVTDAQELEALDAETAQEVPSKTQTPTQKEVAKALKKMKLKVDGVEEDFEYDQNDEEFLKKQFQLARASQKRMKETAEIRKSQETLQTELQQFFELLRNDPKAILTDPNIGVDIKKLAQDVLEQEAREAEKSPEQKQREALQQELEQLKNEREQERKKREDAEFTSLQQKAAQEIEGDIYGAIEKGDLPKSPYVVRKMADYMKMALENNINIRASDIIPIVKKDMQDDIKGMLGILPEEIVEEIVGKDRIASIRKRQLAKSRSTPATKVVNTGADIRSNDKPKEKIPMKDFFKKL